MPKISSYPPDSSLVATDYVLGNSAASPSTAKMLLSALASFFWSLANIPSGGTSPITRDNESQFPYVVANTGVWSGDSYASTLNASMTAATVYINGRRILIAAVISRAFTASKDTYVDVLDNGDGTGTLVYTANTTNAASPALAANSIRIAIIITGSTNIANVGSINQGQELAILPIASSIAYAVTDSLGNLICSRDPNHTILGQRIIPSDFTSTTNTTSGIQVTGASCPIIAPLGRKLKLVFFCGGMQISSAGTAQAQIWEGAVGSGSLVQLSDAGTAATASSVDAIRTPATSSLTYNLSLRSTTGNTATLFSTPATDPSGIRIELA